MEYFIKDLLTVIGFFTVMYFIIQGGVYVKAKMEDRPYTL